MVNNGYTLAELQTRNSALEEENQRLRAQIAAQQEHPAPSAQSAQSAHIDVLGVPIEWELEAGRCTFQNAAVATMFINPTLAGLMSGFQKMVGTKRFFLAMQAEGRKNIDIDWQIIQSQPDFAQGFAAWARFPVLAGWGRWELAELDSAQKTCRIRVHNSFEGLYQQALGVCWGSGVAAGKCAGIFSLLFETNCWAEQVAFLAGGDAYDEFVISPSERSLEQEIDNLLASDEATRADLAVALQRLHGEIAQRKQIETELQHQLEIFSNLINTLPFPIYYKDAAGVYRGCNRAFAEDLHGKTVADIVGKNLYEIFSRKQADFYRQADAEVLATGGTQTYEHEVTFADGSTRTVIIYKSAFQAPDGSVGGLVGALIDITDRKRAEADLRVFKQLADYAPDAVGIATTDGEITYANDAFRTMFGYGDEIVGQSNSVVFSPSERETMLTTVMSAILSRGAWRGEAEGLRKDGSTLPLQVTAFSILDEHGSPIVLPAIIRDVSEQKEQETALRMARFGIDQTVDMVVWVTMDGRIIYANEAASKDLQYTNDELLTMTIADIDAQLTLDEVVRDIGMIRQHGSANFERIHQRKDGSTFPVDVTVNYLLFDDQELLLAVIRDITERKQQESELNLTRFTVDNAIDQVYWIDMDGRHVYVNNTVCTSLGYRRAELLTMSIPDVDPQFPMEQWPAIREQVKAAGNLTFESVHRRKDGSTFPVEIVATYLVYNKNEYICAFARDISERKQREEELTLFKLLVENSPDGIGIADNQGRFTYVNPAYGAMTGYGVEGMHGLTVNDLMAPDSAADPGEIMGQLMHGDGSWQGEATYQHKDGRPLAMQVSAFLARDEQGQILGFPAIVRDITQQKQQENDLRMFKTLVENSTDFVGMATPAGEPIYVNAAGRALMELETEADVQRLPVIEYLVPEDRPMALETALPTVMQQGRWQGEVRFRSFQTHTHIPVEWTVFVLEDPQTGAPTTLATVTRDLRDQKRQEAEREALQQQVIDAQRHALRELSTPLLPIANKVVIMPLIGSIDTGRAQLIMETLLDGVAAHRAELAIIDITGVRVVDTQVAQALVSAAQAVRLLGAQVMLTGIQPQIAQTLVHLGVDLSGIITRGSLQSGIATALNA